MYIEICCNLAGLTHPSFTDPPIPIALVQKHTNAGERLNSVDIALSYY